MTSLTPLLTLLPCRHLPLFHDVTKPSSITSLSYKWIHPPFVRWLRCTKTRVIPLPCRYIYVILCLILYMRNNSHIVLYVYVYIYIYIYIYIYMCKYLFFKKYVCRRLGVSRDVTNHLYCDVTNLDTPVS